jgi:hypothetical protein
MHGGGTRSMQVALQELQSAHLFMVYPDSKVYPLRAKITAVPLAKLEFRRRKIPAEGTV